MSSVFTIRKANEWLDLAAKASERKSLYASVWHEGETVCLMDRAGTGKTALALRIAGEIAATQKVLFVDFASSMRRFADRNPGRFADALHRLEVDRDALEELGPDGMMDRLEEAVEASGIKVCVIDSLTWVCNRFRKADAARFFMRRIAAMRRRLGLSVLVVAEPTRRIEPFLDNVFAVKDLDGEESANGTASAGGKSQPRTAAKPCFTLVAPAEARKPQPRRSLKERLSHPGVRL